MGCLMIFLIKNCTNLNNILCYIHIITNEDKKERTDECISKILYARDGYDRGVTSRPQEMMGIFLVALYFHIVA